MRALLDVNVLIALLDADHSLHARATQWFGRHARVGWAVRHGGQFVTFDSSVAIEAVMRAGKKHVVHL